MVHCTNINEISESFGCSFQWYDGDYCKFYLFFPLISWDLTRDFFFRSLICCGIMIYSVLLCVRMFGTNDLLGCTVSEMKGINNNLACSLHCYERDTSYIWFLFEVIWCGLKTIWKCLEKIRLLLKLIAFDLLNNLMWKVNILFFLTQLCFENATKLSVPCTNMTSNNDIFECSLQRYELINSSVHCTNMIMDNDTLVFPQNM